MVRLLSAIKDTGAGIDPEIMPRLFEKFASKSYQGTGVGIYQRASWKPMEVGYGGEIILMIKMVKEGGTTILL